MLVFAEFATPKFVWLRPTINHEYTCGEELNIYLQNYFLRRYFSLCCYYSNAALSRSFSSFSNRFLTIDSNFSVVENFTSFLTVGAGHDGFFFMVRSARSQGSLK